jgi:hypothetical protein
MEQKNISWHCIGVWQAFGFIAEKYECWMTLRVGSGHLYKHTTIYPLC